MLFVFFLLIQLNLLGWAHSSKWNRFLKKILFENYFPSAWKSGSVWYKAIMKAKILRQQTCVHDLWFDSCMLKLFEKVKCKVSTKLFFTSHINEMVGESHLLLFQELRNCRFKGKMKWNVNSWVEIFYLQKKRYRYSYDQTIFFLANSKHELSFLTSIAMKQLCDLAHVMLIRFLCGFSVQDLDDLKICLNWQDNVHQIHF